MSDSNTCADLINFLDEMKDIDLISTLHDVFGGVLGPLNPPPELPALVPAEQELNIHLQNLSRGFGGCTTLGAAPHSVEPPSCLYSTTGPYSQGQHYIHPQIIQSLSGGYGGYTPLGAAPINVGQAAPILYQGPYAMQPGPLYRQAYGFSQYNIVQLPMNLNQSLQPVAVLTFNSTKRKCEDKHYGQSYVKKPPNACMLFMKEQRPNFVAQMKIAGTTKVNQILGEKRQKRKKKGSNASKMPSAPSSGEDTQQAKMCVTPGYTGAIQAPKPPSNVMEPSTMKTAVIVAPCTQSCVMEPSTSMETNFMAGDKDSSLPPKPQTQLPVSVPVQSQTESNPFDWLEDTIAASFVDMLEYPPPTPQTSPPSFASTDSAPLVCWSNHLAGVEDPCTAELLELLVESLPQPQSPSSLDTTP